jgi:hypothetical protein
MSDDALDAGACQFRSHINVSGGAKDVRPLWLGADEPPCATGTARAT